MNKNPLDKDEEKDNRRKPSHIPSEDKTRENDQGETTGEDYATRQGKTIKEGGPGLPEDER